MDETVTVVIPSYNPGAYLRCAVESVLNQTYHKWHLIIVDDASTDDSLSQIKEFLSDPRIQVIKNSKNVGQSMSMNNALPSIKTKFFMMLDSDDWLCKDSLEILMEESQKVSEDVALIIGNVNVIDEKFKRPHRNVVRNPLWGYHFSDRYAILKANLFPWQKFYRTSHIRDLGGWPTNDPYNGRHAEDLNMFLLLIEKYKFHWVDRVVYNYRLHYNNATNQREVYAEIVKWIVQEALKRWGDEYTAVFTETKDGYILVKNLVRKQKNSTL